MFWCRELRNKLHKSVNGLVIQLELLPTRPKAQRAQSQENPNLNERRPFFGDRNEQKDHLIVAKDPKCKILQFNFAIQIKCCNSTLQFRSWRRTSQRGSLTRQSAAKTAAAKAREWPSRSAARSKAQAPGFRQPKAAKRIKINKNKQK